MAPRLGELLVAKGLLNAAQLDDALKAQASLKGRLGTNLVESGLLPVEQLGVVLSEQRGFPAATTQDFESATPQTLASIPAPFAQEFKAFPLRREAGKLLVALASPFERSNLEPIRSITGVELVPFIAPELVLLYYLEQRYGLKRGERFAKWSPGAKIVPPVRLPTSPLVEPPKVYEPLKPDQVTPGQSLESAVAARPKNATIIFGKHAPAGAPSKPDLFGSPSPAVSTEGPTAPIPPEFLGLASAPMAPVPLAASAPSVVVGGAAADSGQPEMISDADVMDAEPEPAPAPAPAALAVPELVLAPLDAPAPASVAPAAAAPERRFTPEELPAAVLQGEIVAAEAVVKERKRLDDDVTTPGVLIPNIAAQMETEKAEAQQAEQDKAASAPPASPDAPAAPVEKPSEGKLPEIPPDVTPQPQVTVGSPVESEIASLPPAPQRSVETLEERRARTRPPEKRPGSAPSSRFLPGVGLGFVVAALVAGGGFFLWNARARQPDPAPVIAPPVVKECPPPALPPPPEPEKLTLAKADGVVEQLGLDGEWRPVATGATLSEGEQIRTGEKASARLAVGLTATVDLAEYSRLALRRATTAEHRYRLNAGSATLHYDGLPVPFIVENRTGRATAQGKADAAVLSDGHRLAVACRGGSVEIASGAKHVIIPAGKTSSYGADGLLPESPEPSGKIELALDPPRTVPATKSVFLEGTVSGGPALVVVAGSPVSVGADNRFSLEVKAPAKGPFSAVATDLSGNKVTAAFGKAGPAKKPADKPPKKPNKPGKK